MAGKSLDWTIRSTVNRVLNLNVDLTRQITAINDY